MMHLVGDRQATDNDRGQWQSLNITVGAKIEAQHLVNI